MFNQVIIFVKSVDFAIKLDEILRRDNFPSICIHRDLTQEERYDIQFNTKQFTFLSMF